MQDVVLAALNCVTQHPGAIPGTFDIPEFTKNGVLMTPYQRVVSAIAHLALNTDDTMRIKGSPISVSGQVRKSGSVRKPFY